MLENQVDQESVETTGQQNRKKHSSSLLNWTGIFLLIVGLAFIMRNSGLLGGKFNWWAFFILLPAFLLLGFSNSIFHKKGEFNVGVRLMSGTGLITLTVAAMFLLNLDWSYWWPLMLIVPGFVLLMNSFSNRWREGIRIDRLQSLGFWVGGSVALLGVGFLVDELDLVNMRALFGHFSWWGVFILAPGLGSILSSYLNYQRRGKKFGAENMILLVFGLVCSVPGLVAVTGMPWTLLTPIYLMVIGVAMLLKYYYDEKTETV